MKRSQYQTLNFVVVCGALTVVAMLSGLICSTCLAAEAPKTQPASTGNIINLSATRPAEKPQAQKPAATEPEETEAPTYPEVEEVPYLVEKLCLTEDDLEALMQIAMAEAEGEGVKGKALVMLVVLNRFQDRQFPDSIEDVIHQNRNGVYQFSVVAEGGRYWRVSPDEECEEALALVLNGWDESCGAMYFESCKNPDNWYSRNLEFLFKYGGHRFYK